MHRISSSFSVLCWASFGVCRTSQQSVATFNSPLALLRRCATLLRRTVHFNLSAMYLSWVDENSESYSSSKHRLINRSCFGPWTQSPIGAANYNPGPGGLLARFPLHSSVHAHPHLENPPSVQCQVYHIPARRNGSRVLGDDRQRRCVCRQVRR